MYDFLFKVIKKVGFLKPNLWDVFLGILRFERVWTDLHAQADVCA